MRFGKSASVDWTIGKLLNIVLLVLVLVLVFYGISTQSLNPLIENIGAKFDGVLIMFNLKDDISSEECYSEEIVNLGGGKDFLKMLELEGRNIILNVCKNRVCSISGEGLGSYRTIDGVFYKFDDKDWKEYNPLFVGELSSVKFNWEFYNAGVDILEDVEDLDILFYDKPTKKFVLYGDGRGIGAEVYAIWQNGYWEVSEGQKVENYQEGKHFDIAKNVWINKRGQKIIYEGDDDNLAIDKFVEIINRGLNDKVYWQELKFDEDYDEDKDPGRIIGDFVSYDRDERTGDYIPLDNIYNSIMAAEHSARYGFLRGKFEKNYNPWIRTEAIDSESSTAYGPVQLTKGLAESYSKKEYMDWTVEEKKYLNDFINQGWKFLAHGGVKEKGVVDANVINENLEIYDTLGIRLGDIYDSKYDYGGGGELVSLENKKMYEQVVMKMLKEMYERHGEDRGEMWREWRFGLNNMDGKDMRYGLSFNIAWMRGVGDYNKIDSGRDAERLKYKFLEVKSKLLEEVGPSDSEIDKLEKVIVGKSVIVETVKFDLGIERKDGFVISIVSGEKKFGLKYSPHGKRENDFSKNLKKVDSLNRWPFVLVRWDGSEWKEIGNEGYYKLSENNFKEVYEVTLVSQFLKSKCK